MSRAIYFGLGLLLLLSVSFLLIENSVFAGSGGKLDFTQSLISENELIRLNGGAKAPQDTCSLPYPGSSGFSISSWVTGDETYYVYQDPQTSDCASPLPFGITGMSFVVCYDLACTTRLIVEIYDADSIGCPVPGALLYSSDTLTISAAGGPLCPLLGYDFGDTICVNGPFFMSYTFVDSVDCFNLFTDELPGACISYNYAGDTLVDLSDFGFPGQVWMQTVGLDSTQSLCPPGLQEFYEIPEVFANIADLDGVEIKVIGEYIDTSDSKLVTTFGEYMKDELMEPSSILFLDGLFPDSLYWYGGIMIVTGTISTTPETNLVYPQDSLQITITATSYEYIYKGYGDELALPNSEKSLNFEDEDEDEESHNPDACDPCKFAILVSGGGNAAHNKPSYWQNIENLYEYKTKDVGSGGEGYCPENIKVIYFEGNSGNTSAIPHASVDSATEANIQKAHDEIAKKVADCGRAGKDATVQKMFTNHGSNDAGCVLLGAERLSPEELKNMQQPIIDSCCDLLYDEFIECYGGDMLKALKGLDDKGKTEIHGNSAAGENSVGWSPRNGEHLYLATKIRRLNAGDDYETAVDSARAVYQAEVTRLKNLYGRRADSLDSVANSMPPGAARDAVQTRADKYRDWSDLAGTSESDGSPSWVRYQFKTYCEMKKVTCPPGGQLCLKFKGSGGCGNVYVYKENADGSKTRVRVWNWNLPGSAGYQAGNDTRYYNVPETGPRTYWIKNNNGAFTLTIDSFNDQDSTEDASNSAAFAGGSCGGTDSSPDEFNLSLGGPFHSSTNTFSENFDLQNVPAVIGQFGVQLYDAQFTIPAPNPWWNDMYVWINVLDVLQSGFLQVDCPTAEIQTTTLNINAPGEYIVQLGAIDALVGNGQLGFNTTMPGAATFVWDSWGLRTNIPTWEEPEWICGDADGSFAVDISDAVYLISYIFGGGPAPMPLASGDADCSGSVDISDAVYLIAFIFGGGPAPCAECS